MRTSNAAPDALARMAVHPSVERLGMIGVAGFIVLLFLLRDGLWPANAVFYAWSLALAALALARGSVRLQLSRTWPYLLYAAALVASLAASPTPEAWVECGRQGAFFLVVFGVARHVASQPRPRIAVGLIMLFATIVLGQAVFFAVVLNRPDRLTVYEGVIHWSGYPELGMLAAIGCGMSAALVAVGRWQQRVASAVLAASFASIALWLQSRSAWIAIAAAVVWLAAMALVRWRRVAPILLLIVLALLAGGLARTSPLLRHYMITLRDAPQRGETKTRVWGWETALEMVRDHPWLGVGPGMYRVEYPRYSRREDATHAYNLVLHVAADLGIVGATCYVVMWGRVLLLTLARAGTSPGGAAAFAAHGALVAFFVRSQSEHFLANIGTSVRLLLLLGVLFGIAEGQARPAVGRDD